MALSYEQLKNLISIEDETAVSNQNLQTETLIAVNAQDGTTITLDQEESLAEKHKKLLIALCYVLVTQAGSFSVIQILDMLSMLIGNLVPKPIQTIAIGSGLALLGIAEITALIELAIRIKLLADAKAETVSENRIFSTLSLLKLITVSTFCLNAFFEQTGTPDSKVTQAIAFSAPGILFATLIFGEIMNDIKMFLSLPSRNFWSVTFFIDCIFKIFILCAAMMQLFPSTGALPYGAAGTLFSGVSMNVHAAKTQLSHTSQQTSLPLDDKENTKLSLEHSVNVSLTDLSDTTPLQRRPTQVPLSNNYYSRWKKQVSEIVDNIGPYIRGDNLSTAVPRSGK